MNNVECLLSKLEWSQYKKAQLEMLEQGDLHMARCPACKARLANDPNAVVTKYSFDELKKAGIQKIDTKSQMH